MIGNNKMILNVATMQEAIQFWLDSKTIKPMSRVTWVESSADTTFTVSLGDFEA